MTKWKLLVALLTIAIAVSCGTSKNIVDRPIIFNSEREELTLSYMRDRYGIDAGSIEITPRMIVLHWTAIPTLEGSFDAFYDTKIAGWREYVQTISGLNVSSHFLVDQDGTIYQLMPENHMARHVIGLNYSAIGIENVGGTEDTPLTKAQQKSNIWLVKYLSEMYPIEYLIGHYEYPRFEGHELWLEKDSSYRTPKTDPGEDFMRAVRKATRSLNFKPVPKPLQNDQ